MKEPVARSDSTSPMSFIPFALRMLPPSSPRVGAPTELTDKTARDILIALFNGAYRITAARYAGIDESTFHRWMQRKGEPYATFRTWVEEAESAFEMRALNAVSSKFGDKPELAVTMLERKFPERWAKVVATPGAPVHVNLNLTTMLQQIEERGRSVRDPRPPLPGRRTILDVIAEARDDAIAASRAKQPVALQPASPVTATSEPMK